MLSFGDFKKNKEIYAVIDMKQWPLKKLYQPKMYKKIRITNIFATCCRKKLLVNIDPIQRHMYSWDGDHCF